MVIGRLPKYLISERARRVSGLLGRPRHQLEADAVARICRDEYATELANTATRPEDQRVGFKIAVITYTDATAKLDLGRPVVDTELTDSVIRKLFPRTHYAGLGEVSLIEGGFPERRELNVGAFEGGVLIATRDAYLFNPSKLHHRYLKAATADTVMLLTQQSFYDMFAYARWVRGSMIRSISVNPVGRVWEDIGTPEPFEQPFWNGDHPMEGDYPLPFHPLDLSDAALRSVLGLLYEGPPGPALKAPEDVPLRAYRRDQP